MTSSLENCSSVPTQALARMALESYTSPMKRILSWNVNGIRAVEKKGFIDWLHQENPDILCLQETKAQPGQLSPQLLQPLAQDAQYSSYFASARKPGYSGVAIYTKEKPLDVRTMNISEFDDEGRVLVADFPTFSIISAYFPNSQDAGARLPYKLAFCEAMKSFCDTLVQNGRNLVLCGDYNIAHRPIDLARPEDNEQSPGYLPEERAWMESFLQNGYTDTFRYLNGDVTDHYSWWSYRTRARERNIGWRIDYHCVNNAFKDAVKESYIRPDVTGSDHCPVEILLCE